MKIEGQNWVLAGHIGVDAGLCMVGDPSYINGNNPTNALATGDWLEFCNWLGKDYPTIKAVPYAFGHEGAAVVVSSGIGDGYYPVWARVEEIPHWGKRVMELRVVFIYDEEEDEEDA